LKKRGTMSPTLAMASAATAEPVAHGNQRGWMVLPKTSPAARRTTFAAIACRSSVNAPSNARSQMMLMSRGTPPDRR